MGEVVVAYARADQKRAGLIIKKLESLGFSVRKDVAGVAQRLRKRTKVAPPRLVLVSRHYPAVRLAGARRAALAARIDATPLPSIMKTPSVDLRAWRGRDDHRGWKTLTTKLRTLSGAPTKAARASQPIKMTASKPAPAKKGKVGPFLWMAGAAATAAAGAAVFMAMH